MPNESRPPRALEALLDDIEEALARRVGDIAAHRLVGAARGLGALSADAAERLAEGLIEYALEQPGGERRLVVARAELAAHAGDLARLAESLGRLEQRLAALEGR
jgi:ubiquinone biosynthesis protein UbiJ